jgi:hypothetical protein
VLFYRFGNQKISRAITLKEDSPALMHETWYVLSLYTVSYFRLSITASSCPCNYNFLSEIESPGHNHVRGCVRRGHARAVTCSVNKLRNSVGETATIYAAELEMGVDNVCFGPPARPSWTRLFPMFEVRLMVFWKLNM